MSTVAVFGVLVVCPPALPCSLCGEATRRSPTLREEAGLAQARLVLYGTLHDPRLNADGSGVTDLRIGEVLRDDPALRGQKEIKLPRYLPVSNPKDPPKFLVFCDVFEGKLDPYRGLPLKEAASIDYARKSMARKTKTEEERLANLLFYFDYLENRDPEVARDAFLEFAKTGDLDISRAAPKLSAEKLRKWLKDSEVTGERLSLYATLLGSCGTADDAQLLKDMLAETNERVVGSYDGLLVGYIHLRPKEGWELALATLSDGRKPLLVRLGVIRTLRFFQGSQPEKSKPKVLEGLATMLVQGELADVAIEDLRRFGWWDLTPQVLGVWGKKGYDAPLMQRTIVRYALSCKKTDETERFLADLRKKDPELIKEVEESLQLEKKKN
jgi:hypothetical protein